MKVLKPNKNRITQGYSSGHKGYDHSGKGDLNYYSSLYGTVVVSKNSETENWINNGKLTTRDYGNYIKIKGKVDGKVVYQLAAHLEEGSVLPTGTEIKAGQVIARVGNTGNSTGRHSHTEYRSSANVNFPVEFVDEIEKKEENVDMGQSKEQVIIDSYKATTGEYPSDDEKKARLQKNENTVDLITDLLTGDGRSKPRWLEIWEVEESDVALKESLENYKDAMHKLKEILKLPLGTNSEDVLGKVAGLLDTVSELEKAQIPKVIYKTEDQDFRKLFNIGGWTIVIKIK